MAHKVLIILEAQSLVQTFAAETCVCRFAVRILCAPADIIGSVVNL